MYLSNYVHDQLSALNQCDTITIDPHKSGFCPYPAGALCYRDSKMNTFLQITTSVVYYHGDMTLGDIGIEGSKPGAAAASVMLANRVSCTEDDFRVVFCGFASVSKRVLVHNHSHKNEFDLQDNERASKTISI